jgi:hypothetical protein
MLAPGSEIRCEHSVGLTTLREQTVGTDGIWRPRFHEGHRTEGGGDALITRHAVRAVVRGDVYFGRLNCSHHLRYDLFRPPLSDDEPCASRTKIFIHATKCANEEGASRWPSRLHQGRVDHEQAENGAASRCLRQRRMITETQITSEPQYGRGAVRRHVTSVVPLNPWRTTPERALIDLGRCRRKRDGVPSESAGHGCHPVSIRTMVRWPPRVEAIPHRWPCTGESDPMPELQTVLDPASPDSGGGSCTAASHTTAAVRSVSSRATPAPTPVAMAQLRASGHGERRSAATVGGGDPRTRLQREARRRCVTSPASEPRPTLIVFQPYLFAYDTTG